MTEETLNRLKDLASGLGPLYTTPNELDHGVYYRDDLGNQEIVLSGLDSISRDAIVFLVEALAAITGHSEPIYREDDPSGSWAPHHHHRQGHRRCSVLRRSFAVYIFLRRSG